MVDEEDEGKAVSQAKVPVLRIMVPAGSLERLSPVLLLETGLPECSEKTEPAVLATA
jgi:hypothetical protein